ncbi:MAG: 4Fe-4S binding protein [Coriobacteriia bacterium]
MDKLTHIERVISHLDAQDIRVDPHRCMFIRHRKSSCDLCRESCPVDAIHKEEGRLWIDYDACTRCAACTTVCPSNALFGTDPTSKAVADEALQFFEQGAKTITIACSLALRGEEAGVAAEVVAVPCLDRIDEYVLIGLLASGVERIDLCSGACRDCKVGSKGAVSALVTKTSEDLLSLCGHPGRVRLIERIPSDIKRVSEPLIKRRSEPLVSAKGLSRKGFLDSVKALAGNLVAGAALAVFEDEKAPDPNGKTIVRLDEKISPKDCRSGKLLRVLSALGIEETRDVTSRLWGMPQLDEERCTACLICTRFCPTDALEGVQNEETDVATIDFHPDACIHCRLCEDVCFMKALTLGDTVPASCLSQGSSLRLLEKQPAKQSLKFT